MARLIVMSLLITACGAAPASDHPDAGDTGRENDAFVPPSVDSGSSDAGVPGDTAPADGRVDATAADSGTCECPLPSDCRAGECIDGACIEMLAADGTTCGEMGTDVCVAGTCVMRGCGDGYREPGSSAMREACDDGNMVDGDACSSSCVPSSQVLFADTSGDLVAARLTSQGPSIGIDGRGEVLVVWGEQSPSDGALRAQRLTRGGVPVGAPIEIDPAVGAPITAEVVTTGLSGGGWVVVWEAWRSTTRDIVYRVIAPDGTRGTERVANAVTEGFQDEARVAAVGDGFVIVWTDSTSRLDDPQGGIRARLFDAAGSPMGGEMFVATDRSVRESRAQIASSGSRWAVLYHRSTFSSGTTTLQLRRFDGATPRDSAEMQAAPDGGRAGVITALDSGDLAVAWMNDAGDVFARVVDDAAPALVDTDVVPVAMTSEVELRPVIAPLGAGFVVMWEESSPMRIRFAADATAMLAPEAMLLAMELDAGGSPPASMVASPDGLWFAWTGYGFGTPAEALAVFHLPRD